MGCPPCADRAFGCASPSRTRKIYAPSEPARNSTRSSPNAMRWMVTTQTASLRADAEAACTRRSPRYAALPARSRICAYERPLVGDQSAVEVVLADGYGALTRERPPACGTNLLGSRTPTAHRTQQNGRTKKLVTRRLADLTRGSTLKLLGRNPSSKPLAKSL